MDCLVLVVEQLVWCYGVEAFYDLARAWSFFEDPIFLRVVAKFLVREWHFVDDPIFLHVPPKFLEHGSLTEIWSADPYLTPKVLRHLPSSTQVLSVRGSAVFPVSELVPMPELRALVLMPDQQRVIFPNNFAQLFPNLEHLALRVDASTPLDEIRKHPRLKHLVLEYEDFDKRRPSRVNLKSYLPFPEELLKFRRLETLELYNIISHKRVWSLLKSLPNLQKLKIRYWRVTTGLFALGRLRIPYDEIGERFPNLKEVQVNGEFWSRARDARPVAGFVNPL